MITTVSDEKGTQLENVQARVRWQSDHPVLTHPLPANQMAVQVTTGPDGVTPDTVLLAFGFLTGPILIGSEDDQRQQLLEITQGGDLVLTVEPLVRLSVTPAVANRFLEVLTDVMGKINGRSAEGESR